MKNKKISYGEAIRKGFEYLLENYEECFVIGQGLWSPWYVGDTMKDLDSKFGKERIIDTPVSEAACTGLAIGASLCGSKAIVVHPRMDFMLYAMDPIINQAAKWNHMTGGNNSPGVTIRSIVNRGGEQGAQHSQSLHALFSHIPGIKVVMPSTVRDARDLLVASVLSKNPVIYIDDRWLYETEDEIEDLIDIPSIESFGPKVLREGNDLTIVASSFSTYLALQLSADKNFSASFSSEIIDLRVLNPLNIDPIINSVKKTKNFVVIDGGTKTCGYAAEIISSVVEKINLNFLEKKPLRITLPDAPAPTSSALEKIYYPDLNSIKNKIFNHFNEKNN